MINWNEAKRKPWKPTDKVLYTGSLRKEASSEQWAHFQTQWPRVYCSDDESILPTMLVLNYALRPDVSACLLQFLVEGGYVIERVDLGSRVQALENQLKALRNALDVHINQKELYTPDTAPYGGQPWSNRDRAFVKSRIEELSRILGRTPYAISCEVRRQFG